MTSAERALLLLACGLAAACAGVSEERFNALEAQVKQMQGAVTETGETDPRMAILEKRLSEVEKNTSASQQTLQKAVAMLQDEVAKLASAQNSGPSPEVADAWADAGTVLGVEAKPVVANGDTFEVNGPWLMRELRALAVTGKGPKFSGSKKGVVIRGFKPKSVFDELGIKNGDTVVAINGTPVSSATELAAALRKRNNPTTVELERKRKPLSVTFEVVN